MLGRRCAYIPADFDVEADEAFDPKYMQALFDLGYQLAKDGYPWSKEPPSLEPPKVPVEAPPPVPESDSAG